MSESLIRGYQRPVSWILPGEGKTISPWGAVGGFQYPIDERKGDGKSTANRSPLNIAWKRVEIDGFDPGARRVRRSVRKQDLTIQARFPLKHGEDELTGVYPSWKSGFTVESNVECFVAEANPVTCAGVKVIPTQGIRLEFLDRIAAPNWVILRTNLCSQSWCWRSCSTVMWGAVIRYRSKA